MLPVLETATTSMTSFVCESSTFQLGSYFDVALTWNVRPLMTCSVYNLFGVRFRGAGYIFRHWYFQVRITDDAADFRKGAGNRQYCAVGVRLNQTNPVLDAICKVTYALFEYSRASFCVSTLGFAPFFFESRRADF